MIVFKSVSYKNFLSTGNQPTTIYLNRVSSALITGHNGAGKSTILDAVTFGLYGKPYRNINKPQLMNTVNEKNLVVELDFEVNSVPYRIIRGMKPAVFEIYRDEVLLEHDAAAKDYQKRLEDIVGMNYKAFSQIVILGSARYQSFMDLSTNDRRTIIEEILDITVFSKMNTVLKSKVTDVGLDEKENEYQKEINKTKINGQLTLINSIKNRQKDDETKIQAQIAKHEAEIGLLETEVEQLDSDIQLLQHHNLENLQESLRTTQSKALEVAKKGKEHDKRISFYQTTDVCHSCEQELSSDLKLRQIEKYTEEKSKISALAPTIANAIAAAEAKVEEARKTANLLQEKTDKRKGLVHAISATKTSIQSLSHQLGGESSDAELDMAESELTVQQALQTELEKESVALSEEKHALEICKILLKDDGIKAKIIKQYLPVMNNLINKFLDRMGANYSFHLDEQFNEVIKSRYRDTFSYASFSEGEKQRIDLALMFTWREIAKLKNSIATNLLILDEIGDSSMDGEGTDVLWEILNDMSDTNIFVISHKTANVEKFESHLEFYKEGNFSKIKDSK